MLLLIIGSKINDSAKDFLSNILYKKIDDDLYVIALFVFARKKIFTNFTTKKKEKIIVISNNNKND